MPCLYGWFKDYDCDLVLGIVLGMILMLIVQDVKQYGVKRLVFFPETVEVRHIFDLIAFGDLKQLRSVTKDMPTDYVLSMK